MYVISDVFKITERQTDRQTDRQRDRQADREKERAPQTANLDKKRKTSQSTYHRSSVIRDHFHPLDLTKV